MLKRTTKTRLHLRSIDESRKADGEIAELFREMRQASGLSLEQLAHKLQTSPQTISDLEHGHLSILPPWNESSRVVFEYANMLGLDPEPVLRRIMVQLPQDHPNRPRTQSVEPSYDNMRSNVSAVMNRVPGTQTHSTQTHGAQIHGAVGNPISEHNSPNSHQFSQGYGEFRAIGPEAGRVNANSSAPMVANRRKSGVFVFLLQFLVLLIILGAGYAMWLSVNDPPGYEALRSLTILSWETLVIQIKVWLKI